MKKRIPQSSLRGWRVPFLGLTAGLLFVTAAAAAVPRDEAARQLQATGGEVQYTAPLTPREVRPHAGPGEAAAPGAQDADGEPPDDLGGGTAHFGLPAIVSDGGQAASLAGHTLSRKGRAPSRKGRLRPQGRAFAGTGTFATLETLTGATFANTCTPSGGNCFGAEPPDTQMAVGPTEIVEAVNSNVFVFDRSGNQLNSYPLTAIFQPPGQTVGLTDPKILYDPSVDRFYLLQMVCQDAGCGANNYTHMGISLAESSDPAVGWSVYDYLNDGQDLQDQPKLGFSGDKVTIAVNEYGCKCGSGSMYKQENVIVLQKSDVAAANTVTPAIYNDSSGSTYSFDSMPTTPVNSSTSDNTQYVVWDGQQTSSNYMKLIRVTGTPNANDVDFTGNVSTISIANQTAPPTPVAKGGNLAGDKQNFQSAMVQGNDLWATATDGCTPQFPNPDSTTRDCTRLVEVNLGGNSISTDTDIGTDGTYRINPSVNKDSAGHVFFGFTISDASTFATGAIDGSSLPLPAVLQRVDMAAGDVGYGGGRWGDYSGTQQDPANTNDVWTAQEFGGCSSGCNPAFTGGALWATVLGQFTFHEPTITSISPTQGPVPGGTTVDIFGSEFANGGTTVKFGGNTSSSVTWISSTHIQAVSPPGSAGTVDVTATTPAGTSATSSADHFTYIKIPTTTTYTGATNGDFNDSVTLSARLTNNLTSGGVSGKTINFSVGAESCSDTTNGSGNASCSVTLGDLPGSGYTVSASFAGDGVYLPSGASSPFTVNREESALSYTGALTSHYRDTFTARATLVDPVESTPIASKSLTFTLGVGDSCTATTNGSGVASCSITPHQTGSQTMSMSFAGDAFYLGSSDSASFSITPEETTMTYTGPTVILAGSGGAALTATLVEEGANDADGDPGAVGPDPAQTVTLTVGTNSCVATTDPSGNVSCTIPSISVPLGPETVGASFAGNAHYQAASATANAIVFAFPSTGVFALGNLTVAAATPATTVTWWNSNWNLLNSLSGGSAPPAYKGFVTNSALPTTTPANICSANWTAPGGNSGSPPATVPSYMGVVVASKITKSGNTINGNYARIVVVKTDPGYAPGPANTGSGKIVANFCP